MTRAQSGEWSEKWLRALTVLLLCVWCLPVFGAETDTKDDPVAHALYTKMVQTMREASALSWRSDYRWEAKGKILGKCQYRIWLQKPNYVRLEATRAGDLEPNGILIGDGETFWLYWPPGKPRYSWEQSGKYGKLYDQYHDRFYMKEPAPPGRHSIGHMVGKMAAGMCMTIFDPSTFHGYTDSLQAHMDGVRGLGSEELEAEPCDVIEISFMDHQRSWQFWIAKKDHLPRKLKETVRVSYEIKTEEVWSDIILNHEVPRERFSWRLPEGWKQWRTPDIEEGLLKPGTLAPDFELTSAQGEKLRLSSFRGQIVWLNKWRCG